jgi:hypothetical protein
LLPKTLCCAVERIPPDGDDSRDTSSSVRTLIASSAESTATSMILREPSSKWRQKWELLRKTCRLAHSREWVPFLFVRR